MTNKKDILLQFGASLKKARELKKMTMADVEALTNIETGNIAKIEAGSKNIELITLLKLLAALDIDANALINHDLLSMVPKP